MLTSILKKCSEIYLWIYWHVCGDVAHAFTLSSWRWSAKMSSHGTLWSEPSPCIDRWADDTLKLFGVMRKQGFWPNRFSFMGVLPAGVQVRVSRRRRPQDVWHECGETIASRRHCSTTPAWSICCPTAAMSTKRWPCCRTCHVDLILKSRGRSISKTLVQLLSLIKDEGDSW
jgi:hypothetical protein